MTAPKPRHGGVRDVDKLDRLLWAIGSGWHDPGPGCVTRGNPADVLRKQARAACSQVPVVPIGGDWPVNDEHILDAIGSAEQERRARASVARAGLNDAGGLTSRCFTNHDRIGDDFGHAIDREAPT